MPARGGGAYSRRRGVAGVQLRRELDRRIISLAIPALGTLAIEPLYVLVDTAIVGRLGTPQLAGLAIAMTILLTVISLTAFAGIRRDHPTSRSPTAPAIGRGRDVATGAAAGGVDRRADGCRGCFGGGPARVGCSGVTVTCWVRRDLSANQLRRPPVCAGHLRRSRRDARCQRPTKAAEDRVGRQRSSTSLLEIVAVYWLDLGVAGSAWSTVFVQTGAAMMFLRVLRPHRAVATIERADEEVVA